MLPERRYIVRANKISAAACPVLSIYMANHCLHVLCLDPNCTSDVSGTRLLQISQDVAEEAEAAPVVDVPAGRASEQRRRDAHRARRPAHHQRERRHRGKR